MVKSLQGSVITRPVTVWLSERAPPVDEYTAAAAVAVVTPSASSQSLPCVRQVAPPHSQVVCPESRHRELLNNVPITTSTCNHILQVYYYMLQT